MTSLLASSGLTLYHVKLQLWRNSLQTAINHNMTSVSNRIQAVARALTLVLGYCSILRYQHPKLYNDPLCGMRADDLSRVDVLHIKRAISTLYSTQQREVGSSERLPIHPHAVGSAFHEFCEESLWTASSYRS